jgi:AcrR family transcriptional regulator
MTQTTRLPAGARRQAVLETACRVFSRSSYRGATTADIARETGVTEPVLYRHFASKRDLYLACLEEGWARVHAVWERALAEQTDPKEWLGAMGRAYLHLQARDEKILLVDLWIQALTEASEDPKIRRYVREQLREVHAFVADVIRRSQEAGGILRARDPDAEAWIFVSLGLLTSFDRRLGCVVGEQIESVFRSRREWMLGPDQK